ncbi:hypothetical protein C8R43DRAFT_947339 [Mycena crocata]|nr:hypothetical protein C8R43DRAFT_947339 [Mycena crocata]
MGSVTVTQQLFGCLALPDLQKFKLRSSWIGWVSDPEEIRTPLCGFLARSPLLEVLNISIREIDSSPALAAKLLHGLPPTLRTLHIEDVANYHSRFPEEKIHNCILDALTPSPDSPVPCCPGLQELQISQCFGFSDERILRFMIARMTLAIAACQLQRIVVEAARQLERDIVPDLSHFMERGLCVHLTYPPPPKIGRTLPWDGLPYVPEGPRMVIPY